MSGAKLSHGVLYAAGILFNRLVPRRIIRFRVFRVFELSDRSIDQEPAGQVDPLIKIRRCDGPHQLEAAKRVTHFSSDAESAGDDRYEAVMAWEQDQPIGGLWQAHGAFEEDELGMQIDLQPNQTWIFSAYVDKSHRGQGVYKSMLKEVIRNDQAHSHFASINPTNRRSNAAHERFIVAKMGTCCAFRVFGVAFAYSSGRLSLDRFGTLNSRRRPIRMTIRGR